MKQVVLLGLILYFAFTPALLIGATVELWNKDIGLIVFALVFVKLLLSLSTAVK